MASREKDLLEEHGTKLMALKPSSIWAAAMADLERRQRNEIRVAQGDGDFEQYAFHRKHVKKASTPNDILRAAMADPVPGYESAKATTRMLYSDPELLKAALK